MAVGHHRDGDRLGLVEDDVLPVVHHAPVGPRLAQDGVEPAPARPQNVLHMQPLTCYTRSRLRQGLIWLSRYVPAQGFVHFQAALLSSQN